MLTRENLLSVFKEINSPANIEEIKQVEKDLNWNFSPEYITLLLSSS